MLSTELVSTCVEYNQGSPILSWFFIFILLINEDFCQRSVAGQGEVELEAATTVAHREAEEKLRPLG